ncbi:MAG: 30S ribosomal protein S17 [Candidatus Omnitrophica bacterium]|nr:30S ribosomal protein S17 [Candidatus Omnitrophota bacterium]MDD5352210.1 30S ribosomal protein S17 [Candidatus Omnitrophota bacterium]MDD5549808.1 30S ribosomal protein S17 [Candidatus Omnitrophota bacterium]
MTDSRGKRKERTGIVISDKMQKTIIVRVERSAIHPKYTKILKKFNKFKVHDEKKEAKIGDRVLIIETRPVSKDKRWRLIKVLK